MKDIWKNNNDEELIKSRLDEVGKQITKKLERNDIVYGHEIQNILHETLGFPKPISNESLCGLVNMTDDTFVSFEQKTKLT